GTPTRARAAPPVDRGSRPPPGVPPRSGAPRPRHDVPSCSRRRMRRDDPRPGGGWRHSRFVITYLITILIIGLQMKRATVAILIALLAVACGNGGSEQPRIVVTTNILGDVVRAVAGDEAVVEVLIPLGADPHEFQASSAQVATMARADLVVANGLGLEEGLITVLEGLKTDGVNVFEVAPQLDPIEFAGDHDEEEEGGGHAHDLDPHVWMDPLRMARAAELVSDE